MAIASDFLIWQENGHILCRVTTNADLGKLRARLAVVGLSDAVEDIRADMTGSRGMMMRRTKSFSLLRRVGRSVRSRMEAS